MRSVARRLRVVADTNVLFSALAFPKDTPPARILHLARSGTISLLASPFILHELEHTLAARAGWDAARLALLLRRLRSALRVVEPTRHLRVITRIDADNRILECALEAKADALVTGNLKDIRPLGSFRGIPILTPREFLDEYFPHLLRP